MKEQSRYNKINKEKPVLCFRATPELKEIIIGYAFLNGYVDDKTGDANINFTLFQIVQEFLKLKGHIKLKYESPLLSRRG